MLLHEYLQDLCTRLTKHDWSTSEGVAKHGPQAALWLALDDAKPRLTYSEYTCSFIVRLENILGLKRAPCDKDDDLLRRWAEIASLPDILRLFEQARDETT